MRYSYLDILIRAYFFPNFSSHCFFCIFFSLPHCRCLRGYMHSSSPSSATLNRRCRTATEGASIWCVNNKPVYLSFSAPPCYTRSGLLNSTLLNLFSFLAVPFSRLYSQEDELRRTLLKGINTMNLEALNIFQHASGVDGLKAPGLGLDAPSQSHYDSAFIQTAAGTAFNAHHHATGGAAALPQQQLPQPPSLQPGHGYAAPSTPQPRSSGEFHPQTLRGGGHGASPAMRRSGNGLSSSMEGIPRPRGSAPRPMVERHVGRVAK